MYTTYYNLREEPFRLTSDPRFFHLAEPHAASLATLVEAVMRRKGFLLMTGPIGTGKTTVVHTALQILTERAATGHPISDRKSTRLNSSHLVISYAVFCLTKKKIVSDRSTPTPRR